MSKIQHDINDNEIRIISASKPEAGCGTGRRRLWVVLSIIAGVILLAGVAVIVGLGRDSSGRDMADETTQAAAEAPAPIIKEDTASGVKGYVNAVDTIVNGKGLLILSPEHARPRLVIGVEALNDSSIVLATQAADVRSDNGQIAGAFVLNGELISKGEAKSGFCAIIDGQLSLGIADATPMLEQTLTAGGYFFRQYPLVVGGQIVENKPRGRSIRKALAEIGGRTYVVMSREILTFHDFSQLLIDAGARNAIYLVGSSSHGFYVNESGEKVLTGKAPCNEVENISYIVWERM